MDIEPLKALADTEEEEDYESGPPYPSSGHNLGFEKFGLVVFLLFMLLATCRG